MKNFLLFSLLLSLVVACTENKSVTEKLDLDEVANLVEKDTLYEQIISEVEAKRKLISDNIVLQSKFKDLSIGDYYKYKKQTLDSNFVQRSFKKAEKIYNYKLDSLLAIYKSIIDSTMLVYKEQNRLTDPSSYFKVEFWGISKEYYSYDYDVKNVNIKFRITPLKGPIQGGSFNYKLIPKVTQKSVADGGCRFSSYTSKPSIYTWEADYDVEKELKYSSTNSVKNKYDFEYTILTVRKNNKTYSALDKYNIPIKYLVYIEQDTLSRANYASIISSEYHVNFLSKLDFFTDIYQKEKKKLNHIAYDFENIFIEKN